MKWMEIYFHPDNYGWIEDRGEMEKRNLCVEKGRKGIQFQWVINIEMGKWNLEEMITILRGAGKLKSQYWMGGVEDKEVVWIFLNNFLKFTFPALRCISSNLVNITCYISYIWSKYSAKWGV